MFQSDRSLAGTFSSTRKAPRPNSTGASPPMTLGADLGSDAADQGPWWRSHPTGLVSKVLRAALGRGRTQTEADNGINRIALAVLVAVGAVSAMGVGLTIFLATIYGAAPFLIPLGIVSALGIGLVAAVVADPWILRK